MRILISICFCALTLWADITHADQLQERIDLSQLQGIYCGYKIGDVDKTTIRQLQQALQKLYNIKLPLLSSPGDITPDIPVLILGREAALEISNIKEKDLAAVSSGGYLIRTEQNKIIIAGYNDWNTRYGAYYLLEKMGVRFFSPQFKHASYPENPLQLIPKLSIIDTPAFTYRSGINSTWRQMYYQLANPRKGLDPEIFNRKKTGSDLWIDHTAGYLVPKRLYYEKHPEFYAMKKNGERIAFNEFTDHRTPLCLSNKAVARISTERALGWIAKQPDNPFFMVTYGDTGLWCKCTQCEKLDSRPGKYSDRLLSWVNPIARAVAKSYPDVTLLTFAYGGTDDPPPEYPPESNVWIVGSTGLGNVPFWDHSALIGDLPSDSLKKMHNWLQVVPNRYAVCEYQSKTYKPALIDSLTARLRYYQKRGVRGIVFTYGKPKNFSLLWQYLWGHLLWNPNQDPMLLAREFIYHYYHPVGDTIWNIFVLYHQQYRSTLHTEAKLQNRYPEGFYSDNFVRQVLVSFAKAIENLPAESKLRIEVQKEEQFFIEDWMKHPTYNQINEDSRKIILMQLSRQRWLVNDNEEKEINLARSLHRLALSIEPDIPGTLKIFEDWLKTENLIEPKFDRLDNGIRLPPESYMFAGFGPAKYGYNCPPKDATGIYVKGNEKHRSHRMVVDFSLDNFELRKKATLHIEGQASDIMSIKPKILILLNKQKVYSGPADFVKNNWSRQSYQIPDNILRVGKNKLEIINMSSPLTVVRWNQRWVLVADTVIDFE